MLVYESLRSTNLRVIILRSTFYLSSSSVFQATITYERMVIISKLALMAGS